jgi:hypothetical protein
MWIYDGDLEMVKQNKEYIEVTESDWYKETAEITIPAGAMRIYRKNHQLTQEELGKKMGNVPARTERLSLGVIYDSNSNTQIAHTPGGNAT